MFRPNSSSGGGTSVSAARRSAPVRRWAGPISATGWLPRTMVIVSPRSTASRRSEKCRDASVAVIVFMQLILSDNQIRGHLYGQPRIQLDDLQWLPGLGTDSPVQLRGSCLPAPARRAAHPVQLAAQNRAERTQRARARDRRGVPDLADSYAEHSFNASMFTARVVASTLSNVYSAVTAAIGALKGPAARRRQRGRDGRDGR